MNTQHDPAYPQKIDRHFIGELLPCPFCGYDEQISMLNVYLKSKKLTMKKCECPNCKASTSLSPTATLAAKKWNTREYYPVKSRTKTMPVCMAMRALKARELAAKDPESLLIDKDGLPWIHDKYNEVWLSLIGNYSRNPPIGRM